MESKTSMKAMVNQCRLNYKYPVILLDLLLEKLEIVRIYRDIWKTWSLDNFHFKNFELSSVIY